MTRAALFVILVALASLAAPPASAHGRMSAAYVLGGGELSHGCPALVNAGGACFVVPEPNANRLTIALVDDLGLPVGGYFEVHFIASAGGDYTFASGFFCGTQVVDT